MNGRRSFLVAAGSTLLAGCAGLGVGSGGGDAGSDGDSTRTDGDSTRTEGSTTDGGGDSTAADGSTAPGSTAGGDTATGATTATATPTTRATPTGTPQSLVDRTIEVEEKDWARYGWGQSGEATLVYEFEVVEGPAIDALVLTRGQYDLFARGQSAEYVDEASAPESTGDRIRVTLQPPEDRYVLLFDNSYFGPSGPPRNALDDTAAIEVTATLYRP